MSWTVVEFIETNEVESVPTSWLHNNNECYWPTLDRQKLFSEIRKGGAPNTCWPLYKVRVFKHATYNDYLTSRRKCRTAEATSDLGSTDEGQKRKTRKNPIYSSSSEDEDTSLLPKPPKLTFTKPNIPSDISCLALSDSTNKTYSKSTNDTLKSSFRNVSASSPLNSLFNDDEPINATNSNQMLSSPSSSNANLISRSSSSNMTLIANKNCSCAEHQKNIENILLTLVKGQNTLRAQILQLREDLKESTQDNEFEKSFFKEFTFPMSTEHDLERVNEYLKNEENYAKVVKDFYKIGGRDAYDHMKRCLSRVLANKLASEFSYHGARQKKAFKDLKLNNALLDSLLMRGNENKKDGELAIQKWLRRAKERKE